VCGVWQLTGLVLIARDDRRLAYVSAASVTSTAKRAKPAGWWKAGW